jgi:hypothetical protein
MEQVYVVFCQYMTDAPRLLRIFKHEEDAEAYVKKVEKELFGQDSSSDITYWMEVRLLD